MPRTIPAAVAILAGAATLEIAAWFDTTVMQDARNQAAAAFDLGGVGLLWAIGSIGIAGSVLALGTLAWRSRSIAVGVVYVAIGAFFAFLPMLLFGFGASVNDAPPVLPQPVADLLGQVYSRAIGPMNAVVIIGAGMLLAGLAVIGRRLRPTPVTDGTIAPSTIATEPSNARTIGPAR